MVWTGESGSFPSILAKSQRHKMFQRKEVSIRLAKPSTAMSPTSHRGAKARVPSWADISRTQCILNLALRAMRSCCHLLVAHDFVIRLCKAPRGAVRHKVSPTFVLGTLQLRKIFVNLKAKATDELGLFKTDDTYRNPHALVIRVAPSVPSGTKSPRAQRDAACVIQAGLPDL